MAASTGENRCFVQYFRESTGTPSPREFPSTTNENGAPPRARHSFQPHMRRSAQEEPTGGQRRARRPERRTGQLGLLSHGLHPQERAPFRPDAERQQRPHRQHATDPVDGTRATARSGERERNMISDPRLCCAPSPDLSQRETGKCWYKGRGKMHRCDWLRPKRDSLICRRSARSVYLAAVPFLCRQESFKPTTYPGDGRGQDYLLRLL